MKEILTVMEFTMKDMIRRKSFIVSTIIILLMIIIGFNIPRIVKSFSSSDVKSKVLIVDKDNIFDNNLELLNENNTNFEFVIEDKSIEEVKEAVKNNKYNTAIIITKEENSINLLNIVENMFLSDGMDSYLVDSINELYKNIQIKKLNLSNEVLKTINIPFTVSYDEIDSVDGNPFALMALSILLFYAIYFCAYQVSSSITTEKTSKIIETLVTSTSPNNIVIGKTLGIGLVGLLQIILYMLTAFISAKLFMDKELITALMSSTNISFGLALITLLYFILGYFAFAFLYALTGSTVAKPEDIQSANSPVAILSLFGFYLAYFTMMNPTSNLNYFASLFPLSSPFCVPFRIMMGISTFKDVILSLLILVITIIIVARITIRIYKNAILNYGSKMSFKDIINMYKQK